MTRNGVARLRSDTVGPSRLIPRSRYGIRPHNQRHGRRRRLALVPEERDAAAGAARAAIPARVFNDTGPRRSPATSWSEFLRGHAKAITGLDVLDEAVFSRGAGAADRQQVRRRPRHDRSRRRAAPRRLGAVDARREPSGGRRADDLLHDRARAAARAARARARATAAGGSPAAASSRPPTVGVVGCGHVGQQVARFVPRVRRDGARARHPRLRRFLSRRTASRRSRSTRCLPQSDIVTIHLPLDASTRGLIDARALARMKPTAFLVNTARGGIVDEQALKEALLERTPRRRRVRRVRGRAAGRSRAAVAAEFHRHAAHRRRHREAVLAMGRAAIAGLDGGSAIDST